MFIKSNVYKKIYKLLDLDKPLVIFDLETTGRNISSDKIITLALIKILHDGKGVKKEEYYFDPEMPIGKEATSIHGIENDHVVGRPKFREKAQEIYDLFSNSYYSGFNVMSYDLPILRREFVRVGMDFDYDLKHIVDAKEVYKFMAPRTLSSAYEYYCWKEHKGTAGAMKDAEVAGEILLRQLEKYQEVRDWQFLNNIHRVDENFVNNENNRKFYWQHGETYFTFTKYRGKRVAQIAKEDPDYLRWMLSADFSPETKSVIRKHLNV